MRPFSVIDVIWSSTKLSLLSEYSTRSLNRLRLVWYVIHLLLLGVWTSPKPPCQPTDDEKTRKKNKKNWPMAYIGRHTRLITATSVFRDRPGPPLSGNALSTVPAHRQGQRNGRQVGYFFAVFFWHKTPLSVWCDMKWIIARSRRPVASREALDPLYRLILAVTCWRIILTVKTCRTVVHLFVVDDFVINLTPSN